MHKTFATVCSGIGAPEVACARLGWKPKFSAEIEKFPSAVLAHHHKLPNYGDMTKFHEWPNSNPDVLIAGTPCQAFSVAGLRKGLADPRGNLTLTFLGIIERYAPRWMLWENVPGILSDKSGAFGSFLGGLEQLGYGFSYRILDAQFFGVAQRRRRVFAVGHLGGLWQHTAAVLFERESLCGNPAPRRQSRESFAHELATGLGASGRGYERSGETRGQDPVIAEVCATITKNYATHRGRTAGNNCGVADGQIISEVSPTLRVQQRNNSNPATESSMLIAHSLKAVGFDASEDGTGRGTPIIIAHGQGNSDHEAPILFAPVAFNSKGHGVDCGDISPTLRASAHDESHRSGGAPPAICFDTTQITSKANYSNPKPGEPAHPLANGQHPPAIAIHNSMHGLGISKSGDPMFTLQSGSQHGAHTQMSVRRLTPRECERLQGFPDDYTLIPYRGRLSADGPRYKAIGNSMAVPVIEWICRRMDLVDELAPLK